MLTCEHYTFTGLEPYYIIREQRPTDLVYGLKLSWHVEDTTKPVSQWRTKWHGWHGLLWRKEKPIAWLYKQKPDNDLGVEEDKNLLRQLQKINDRMERGQTGSFRTCSLHRP